ncbi:FAD-binding oxidoreductase [Peteryoungia desertarenae]|uniref:FAD-binding oxidoreductase n=1 Tax=Peteryoungia desertarenae TaxID=1813451 RepID=A0ABX6QIF5_9HYPH|nr:FAD-binding oxidoreductase [Peteryoungia desertarenae]QLF68300.1 FAD-binding oxidoreductase [Peteryoungia desertarenae]
MSDKAPVIAGQSHADVLVIGGGVMGMWAAVKAADRGHGVTLVEARGLGAGASGGLLGALMAHMPDRWNEKKQLQFDALVSLEPEIAALEDRTGLPTGYRRSGRLVPLPKPHLRQIAERHSQEAANNWHQGRHRFFWNVHDKSPIGGQWPDAEFCSAGVVEDTFGARISPRRLLAALAARIRQLRKVTVIEGQRVKLLDAAVGYAELDDGAGISFGHVIVAGGYEAFPLLSNLGPDLPVPLGGPVKGQAALLKMDLPHDYPLIYLDGLYIVPHEDGTVAIGSTSEHEFVEPLSTDKLLDDLLVRARQLAPVLEDAPVIERWAGLRPRAVGRDPMVGCHPFAAKVVALTGGFKVSFGIAHLLANAAIDAVEGRESALPPSFSVMHHISVAKEKA